MYTFGLSRGVVIFLLSFLLAACGFHLRTVGDLPFKSIYVQGAGTSQMSRDLRRLLVGSGVKVVQDAEDAELVMEIMSEQYVKEILSLSGKGKVREYQLIYRTVFRLKNANAENWGAPQTVEQRRDFSYDDSAVLAKDQEEANLVTDMRTEAVREILRRVSSLSKQMTAAQ